MLPQTQSCLWQTKRVLSGSQFSPKQSLSCRSLAFWLPKCSLRPGQLHCSRDKFTDRARRFGFWVVGVVCSVCENSVSGSVESRTPCCSARDIYTLIPEARLTPAASRVTEALFHREESSSAKGQDYQIKLSVPGITVQTCDHGIMLTANSTSLF
jgi:hypothetical protein